MKLLALFLCAMLALACNENFTVAGAGGQGGLGGEAPTGGTASSGSQNASGGVVSTGGAPTTGGTAQTGGTASGGVLTETPIDPFATYRILVVDIQFGPLAPEGTAWDTDGSPPEIQAVLHDPDGVVISSPSPCIEMSLCGGPFNFAEISGYDLTRGLTVKFYDSDSFVQDIYAGEILIQGTTKEWASGMLHTVITGSANGLVSVGYRVMEEQ